MSTVDLGIFIKKSDFVFTHDKNDKFTNDYKVGDVIGKGSFGEVKKCVHIKTKAKRAVKIIDKDMLNPFEQKSLIEEIEILKSLDHPNILKIYDTY